MKPSLFDWSKNQSVSIDLLRFPLAILVIFVHMNVTPTSLRAADFPLISAHGIYNFVTLAMSKLDGIAVPAFFLISGYLFFSNFREWSWNGYKRKMKSRVKTLLVPYILWNIITFLIYLFDEVRWVLVNREPVQSLFNFIRGKGFSIFVNCKVWGQGKNILGWPTCSTGPIDLPLWFLRDLIVVSILSPVIYCFIKKTRLWGILLLFAALVTGIWTSVPGFSIAAFFYFSSGAYFAINGRTVVEFARKYSIVTFPLSILLFCVLCYGPHTVIGLGPFYVVSTILVAFSLASLANEKYGLEANALLVKSCFFIYASHTVAIFLKWTPMSLASEIIHKIIPGESRLEGGICYLLVPFAAAAVCVCTYKLLSRFFPRICSLLTGNRI